MTKAIIIGSGGAGKSTFARQLGELLDIEVSHLDVHFWKANWQESTKEELIQIIEKIMEKDQWIMDGNYGGTFDIRVKDADYIYYLDMPTLLCLYRIIKRRIKYHNKSRPDMNEGCKESLDWDFIKWIMFYRKNKRLDMLKKLAVYKDKKTIVIFKNRKQIKNYLNELMKKQEVLS